MPTHTPRTHSLRSGTLAAEQTTDSLSVKYNWRRPAASRTTAPGLVMRATSAAPSWKPGCSTAVGAWRACTGYGAAAACVHGHSARLARTQLGVLMKGTNIEQRKVDDDWRQHTARQAVHRWLLCWVGRASLSSKLHCARAGAYPPGAHGGTRPSNPSTQQGACMPKRTCCFTSGSWELDVIAIAAGAKDAPFIGGLYGMLEPPHVH